MSQNGVLNKHWLSATIYFTMVDLTGMKFGELTVENLMGFTETHRSIWTCRCSCGRSGIVKIGRNIREENHPSCGKCNFGVIPGTRIRDLSGNKYGRLVVTGYHGKNKNGYHLWDCVCKCGNATIVSTGGLTGGGTTSCGCYRLERLSEAIVVDLVGKRFGRLLVISRDGTNKYHQTLWKCVCDCGNHTIKRGGSLTSGDARSCGCLHKETLSKIATTHGMSKTKEYRIYRDRKRRDLERLYDTEWTLAMDIEVKKFFKKCVICGATEGLQVDHVLPLSRGYGLRPGNAVILCGKHNQSKSDKRLQDLRAEDRDIIIAESIRFKVYWDYFQTLTA